MLLRSGGLQGKSSAQVPCDAGLRGWSLFKAYAMFGGMPVRSPRTVVACSAAAACMHALRLEDAELWAGLLTARTPAVMAALSSGLGTWLGNQPSGSRNWLPEACACTASAASLWSCLTA